MEENGFLMVSSSNILNSKAKECVRVALTASPDGSLSLGLSATLEELLGPSDSL